MPTHRALRIVVASPAAVGCLLLLGSCAKYHIFGSGLARPPQIAGEWVDVAKSTPADTSLWVLRGDGYDGIANLLVTFDASGVPKRSRTQEHYGTWYFEGTLGDTARQSLCFSRRLGRSPTSCIQFLLDTIDGGPGSGRRPRLLLRGYNGEHTTGDRWLIARKR
jgi:hypothetical protein